MSINLDDPDPPLCNITTDPPQLEPKFAPPHCWELSFFCLRRTHSEFLPDKWVPPFIEETPALVAPPSRVPSKLEFDLLHYYQQHLRELLAPDIFEQNDVGFEFQGTIVAPLKQFLAKYASGPFFDALAPILTKAVEDAGAAVIQQKLLFNRARPYHVDTTITPLIPPPGHPSYPSGHSTQSHAVAYVIADVLAAAKDPANNLRGAATGVLSKAREIATNREVAGVHYPSDTAAGVCLARALVDNYRSQIDFNKLFFEPAVDALERLLVGAG